MEIGEFRKKKFMLEGAIQQAVTDLARDFERETGYTPKDISFCIEEIMTMGFPRKFIITDCKVEIEI